MLALKTQLKHGEISTADRIPTKVVGRSVGPSYSLRNPHDRKKERLQLSLSLRFLNLLKNLEMSVELRAQ